PNLLWWMSSQRSGHYLLSYDIRCFLVSFLDLALSEKRQNVGINDFVPQPFPSLKCIVIMRHRRPELLHKVQKISVFGTEFLLKPLAQPYRQCRRRPAGGDGNCQRSPPDNRSKGKIGMWNIIHHVY